MNATPKSSWLSFATFYFLGAVALFTVLFFIRSYFYQRSHLSEEKRREIMQTSADGVHLLNKEITKVIEPLKDLARNKKLLLDQTALLQEMNDLLKSEVMLEAIGIAYVPQKKEGKSILSYFYFVKDGEKVKDYNVDPYYDYTLSPWYRKAESDGESWIDSYYEPASARLVVRYMLPMYRFDAESGNRLPIAYLFIDISRRELMNSINTLDVGGVSNYVIIVSKDGDLISYPVDKFILEYKTLSNLSRTPGKSELSTIAERINRGGQGMMTYSDGLSKDSFFVYFAPIKNTNWSFVFFSHRKSLFYQVDLRRQMIKIGIAVLLLLLFLIVLITKPLGATNKKWWSISFIFSCLLFALLAFQLQISFVTTQKVPNGELIGNRVDLNRFSYFIERKNLLLNKPPIIQIPTGIWIEYILQEKQLIMMSGIIWQKYDKTLPKDIDKTISILNAHDLKLEKMYDVEQENIHLIGWRFRTSLNIEFNYLTYPFDSQILTVKLLHPNFKYNIMLTPDFDAYALAEIAGKTGLGKVYKEASWNIKNSYFSYILSDNATDFGIVNSVRQNQFPNLMYNIVITRNITAPLIGYIFPIIIMAAILFYVLFEASITAVSLSSALARVSGLFLATVFAHQALRRGLSSLAGTGTDGITYLEYIYFIMYFFIMLTLNFTFYIHFKRKGKKTLTNPFALGLKFLYWPLLMTASFLVTLYFFY